MRGFEVKAITPINICKFSLSCDHFLWVRRRASLTKILDFACLCLIISKKLLKDYTYHQITELKLYDFSFIGKLDWSVTLKHLPLTEAELVMPSVRPFFA